LFIKSETFSVFLRIYSCVVLCC